MQRKKVLAISGSTRVNSINHSLINAIALLAEHELEIKTFDSIAKLPQFNPDDDGETVAPVVADFRQQLDEAAGVLICTPEYAHGVPGSLKNAIDWTISSSQFPHKPTMLITASTGGEYGHRALIETLKAIEAKNIDELQMIIPFAKTKISMHNEITDHTTLSATRELITRFIMTIHNAAASVD